MDLSDAIPKINKILPPVFCDDVKIISVVAEALGNKKNKKRIKSFLQQSMNLTYAVHIINNLNINIDSNPDIVVEVAKAFEQKEAEEIEKKQEFLKAVDTINGLKIDISYDFDKEFKENHPILGKLKNNFFFEKPLFEAIQVGMKEPQYTTALGWFLKNDREACRLFIETLAEVAKFPADFELPDRKTPIESIWEYSDKKTLQTEEDEGADSEKDDEEKDSQDNRKIEEKSSRISAGNDVRNRKEIDNLLIWKCNDKKYGIVVEIKFGASLHNELPCYQLAALKKMGKVPYQKKDERHCVFLTNEELNCVNCQKNNPLMCVVLSTNRISAQEIEKNKGCRKIWHRVLWSHFLPKLSEKMAQYQENEDYRRFLSSLWCKVFETERK